METTIIKIGNSLGSRYSKAYLDMLGLKEGDKVQVSLKIARHKPNTQKAVEALRAISKLNGKLANIDVKKWEAERRNQSHQRDQELRDIIGR